jgi:predicted nuclease of predicted toxin-antitoxin system
LKFLIDAQLPPSLEAWFGEKGYEAQHVASLLKADASDAEIWDFAVAGGFVIVTKDRDFVE